MARPLRARLTVSTTDDNVVGATAAPGPASQWDVNDWMADYSTLRNVANVTSSTTPAGTPGRETGSTVSAGSDVSVNAPQISLTKSVDLAQATIGQSLRYTVDVTIPASTQSFDVTVVDQLPAGIAFDGLVSSSSERHPGCGTPSRASRRWPSLARRSQSSSSLADSSPYPQRCWSPRH